MKCKWLLAGVLLGAALCLSACTGKKQVQIGVSMGVGPAVRWDIEKTHMEQRAAELGAQIEVRLDREGDVASQQQDCIELIDAGVDVLIFVARDATKMQPVLEYAKQKKVPVIAYARVVMGEQFDLFVGYDSHRMGQRMGQYLAELVPKGDYILLHGDENDNNATLLHDGAMRYIEPIRDNIKVLTDSYVPQWSPEEAEKIVTEAVKANGNKVDAILAPNDAIAGACAAALKKLGVTEHVVITGMDAELTAVKRLVEGTQDATIYLNLQQLAYTAVDEAVHFALGETVSVNAKFDNRTEDGVDANLITGQLVTKQNLDKVLIETGYFTKEEVYG